MARNCMFYMIKNIVKYERQFDYPYTGNKHDIISYTRPEIKSLQSTIVESTNSVKDVSWNKSGSFHRLLPQFLVNQMSQMFPPNFFN